MSVSTDGSTNMEPTLFLRKDASAELFKKFIYFYFYFLFKAAGAAYESSQARGWIRATAAGLQQRQMELHLRPTPPFAAKPDP